MLKFLAEMVQEEIITEVKQSGVFSIIADETIDLQKKEQVWLVIRYYYRGVIHEGFLDFMKADSLDAAGLTALIIKRLEKHRLEYRTSLVGQGYDGAVMRGEHPGVCTRILLIVWTLWLLIVWSQSLRLVAFTPFFKNYIGFFWSGSYVHTKWHGKMYNGQPRELPKLSDTRWACRHAACRNLLDRLPAVYHLLQEIGLELAAAVSFVESLLDTLQQYRSEAFFEVVWKEVEKMAVKCDLSLERPERRQPEMNRLLCDYILTPSTGERGVDENDKENFKRHAFHPVLNSMTGELQKCFSKPNCTIMKGIRALHPQSITFLQEETLFFLCQDFWFKCWWLGQRARSDQESFGEERKKWDAEAYYTSRICSIPRTIQGGVSWAV